MKTGVAVSVGGLAPRPLEVLQLEGNSPELLVALRSVAQREFVSVRAHPGRTRVCAAARRRHPLTRVGIVCLLSAHRTWSSGAPGS